MGSIAQTGSIDSRERVVLFAWQVLNAYEYCCCYLWIGNMMY